MFKTDSKMLSLDVHEVGYICMYRLYVSLPKKILVRVYIPPTRGWTEFFLQCPLPSYQNEPPKKTITTV